MAKDYNIFVISDSSGGTAMSIAKTASAQFPENKPVFSRYPFIQTKSILEGVLKLAKKDNAVIFYTLVSDELSKIVLSYAMENGLYSCDCIQKPIHVISEKLNEESSDIPGLAHSLDKDYFKRIADIEFAVENDDGRNPQNLDQADIVILGVSRTSKTPLSLYLANQGLKVANVPIGPTLSLPKEIYDVDPKKIFGLTNSVKNLRKIRKARMVAYGLEPDTPYSSDENIKKELDYAKHLYKKLGCATINVYNKSIEETATVITESLNIDKNDN